MNFAYLWQILMWVMGLGSAIQTLPVGGEADVPMGIFITWQDGRRFVIESGKIRRLV